MELKSLKEILRSATSQADIKEMLKPVQEQILWAVAENRDLTDCAIWLKNAIEIIDLQVGESKKNSEIAYAVEGLRDLYEDELLRIRKLLIVDPSRI